MEYYEQPHRNPEAPRRRRDPQRQSERPARPAASRRDAERPRRPRPEGQPVQQGYQPNYPAQPGQQPAQPRPQSPRRKPRPKRKPPIRALAICAGIIFLAGFLMGFLVRGFFLPKDKPEESKPPVDTKPPVVQTPPETTLPPETTVPPTTLPPETETPWNLVLANPWNPIPEGYEVSLTQLANGLSVDKRCYTDLQAMISACRLAGLSPVVASAYRTMEEQTELFESKVRRLQGEGWNETAAREQAAREVAVPGTSEHHLGLAVDLVDQSYQGLDEKQEETAVQKWLMEHCWEYGFILRYPNGKSSVTGIIYEPWHYRYVGKEYAAQIKESGLCFEEWLQQR